jgi:ribosomal protein L23
MAKKAVQPKTEKAKKDNGRKADIAILRHPRVTEKTANANGLGIYVFDVALSATKSEIAKAFAVAYKHTPLRVRTLIRKPKAYSRRTTTRATNGFGKAIKKAYIYLPKGTTIDIM